MSRELSSHVTDASTEDVIEPFFAIDLLFDSPNEVYMWSGRGNVVVNGNTYIGAGGLLNVSSIEEASDLSVKGATLTLSGIDTSLTPLALSEPYQGRKARIYVGMYAKGFLLNEDGSFILTEDGGRLLLEPQDTSFDPMFTGYMDELNITEDGPISTILLKIESKLIDLERPRPARYTSSYQKSKYPDDKGLDFVEAIQDQELQWG